MTGLILLATVVIWLGTCFWLSRKLSSFPSSPIWRQVVKWCTLTLLLISPFVDEAIGKYQFASLCKFGGIESANVSRGRGKRVRVEYGERVSLSGTTVPIHQSDVMFRDADTGEVLIRHKNYYSSGGWLMRNTWLGMGANHPILFDGSTCDLRKEQEIFKENSITLLYK